MKHQRAIKLLQCALFWAAIINVVIAEASGTDEYSHGATSTTHGESGTVHSAGDDYYVSHGDDGDDDDQHAHPVTAILFPWFSEIIGVLTFFVISVS